MSRAVRSKGPIDSHYEEGMIYLQMGFEELVLDSSFGDEMAPWVSLRGRTSYFVVFVLLFSRVQLVET